MKILLISRCPPYPLYLGDRLIVYHLGQELEGRRHEIDLLAFAEQPSDWTEQRHYEGSFHDIELIDAPKRSALSYARRQLAPFTRFPRWAGQSSSPVMWEAIVQRLAQEQYDVVQLFGGVQVYEFKGALGNLPTVITPYESYSLYLRRALDRAVTLRERLSLAAQGLIARGFESWMFAPYDRTVVVSPPDRAALLALNPKLRVEVIPNGVDLIEFKARPTERSESLLLFVGNYEYAPNVDAALRLATELLPRVRQRVPEVKLYLVGNAPPPELLALVSESITVTGRVPDVRPYLARAAAFVSPLRLGAGIKNKVLEALAMGCPVVATPLSVDGIAVTDGHDALIADNDGLIDATLRVLQDADLRQKLSANARILIEAQYSWMRVGQMYEALYEQVIAEHSTSSQRSHNSDGP